MAGEFGIVLEGFEREPCFAFSIDEVMLDEGLLVCLINAGDVGIFGSLHLTGEVVGGDEILLEFGDKVIYKPCETCPIRDAGEGIEFSALLQIMEEVTQNAEARGIVDALSGLMGELEQAVVELGKIEDLGIEIDVTGVG